MKNAALIFALLLSSQTFALTRDIKTCEADVRIPDGSTQHLIVTIQKSKSELLATTGEVDEDGGIFESSVRSKIVRYSIRSGAKLENPNRGEEIITIAKNLEALGPEYKTDVNLDAIRSIRLYVLSEGGEFFNDAGIVEAFGSFHKKLGSFLVTIGSVSACQ